MNHLLHLLLLLTSYVNAQRVTFEHDQGLPNTATLWRKQQRSKSNTKHHLILHLSHTEEQQKTLEKKFWSVSQPDHENYGNHLTQDQVTALVEHPKDKLQLVMNWLLNSGASNVNVNAHKDSISFVATSKQVKQLFDTEMYAYVLNKDDTRDITLHRAARSYSIPNEYASSVALVSGILRLPDLERLGGNLQTKTTFSAAEATDATDATDATAGTAGTAGTPWPSDCNGCSQKVTPGVLAARYSFPIPTTTDAPSTLAISEFQGQVWDQAGLDSFSKACSGATGSINFNITVNHENGTISPGKQCKIPIFGTNICGEAMLDIEYAKAIAGPTIPLTDLYQKSFNLLEWSTSVENINDANLIGVHSVSYGNDEKQQSSIAFMTSFNMAAMKIGIRGVSILFASGDQGVCGRSGCGFGKNVRFHPDFPSGSPYITSVGGTDFVTRSIIGDEKAWQSGGGGFSDTFSIPNYQKNAVATYKNSTNAKLPPQTMWNNTGRGYPDISALAGQQNSYCISVSGGLLGIYGTSAATPVTAAIFARLNGIRIKNGGQLLGFLNPWIYQNSAAFNDVTQGVNNHNLPNGFTAIEGWDASSGVGTPNFAKMVKAL